MHHGLNRYSLVATTFILVQDLAQEQFGAFVPEVGLRVGKSQERICSKVVSLSVSTLIWQKKGRQR
jgi:hypothetical protein